MSDLPPQASFWGLTAEDLQILTAVTAWFNGGTFITDDEDYCIATDPEPSLATLLHVLGEDYRDYEDAHDRLLRKGLLEEKYICRQQVDWVPTEEGREAIRDCLTHLSDQVRPSWADEDARGPLFGDPNEGLLHRKGVELAGRILPWRPWASDQRSGPYGVEWYPTNAGGQSCHDLHVDTVEWQEDVGVEVITDSNNPGHLADKWSRYQSQSRVTFWVFDSRETACRMWNLLDRRGDFYLDGQFRNLENWSADAINAKIWRSSKKYRDQPTGDIVYTVTGLLEGGRDRVQDLFEAYYSNK
jgi:hypothetical protein